MEVISHNIDEVQVPETKIRRGLKHLMTLHIFTSVLCQFANVMIQCCHTYLATSAISYPASIVPLPADTAADSISLGLPVAMPSAS